MNPIEAALNEWAQNLLTQATTMALWAVAMSAILTWVAKKWGMDSHPLKIFVVTFVIAMSVQFFGQS